MFNYADDRRYPQAWIALINGKKIRVEETYYLTRLGYYNSEKVFIDCYSGPNNLLKQNGVHREWTKREGGQIIYESYYKDNLKHGPQASWYDNGNLRYTYSCNEDKMDGLDIHYYEDEDEDGKVREVNTYVNNVLNGEYLLYYPDGVTLQKRGAYRNKYFHGFFTEYYQDGSVMREYKYEDGHSRGKMRCYYPYDRSIKCETNNENNMLEVKTWYPKSNNNQSIQRQVYTIKDGGKYEADYREWYENGCIRYHLIFHKGRLNGICRIWYNNNNHGNDCGEDDDENCDNGQMKEYHSYKKW